MKRTLVKALVFILVCSLIGCSQRASPHKSWEQTQREEYIRGCDKSDPPYTLQQKARMRNALEKRRLLVVQAIYQDARMRGARLEIATVPEAIEANCSDALRVGVNGMVVTVRQKRVLQAICRRYTDNLISVYGSEVG